MNERIIEALNKNNKWWTQEFKIDFRHRDIYDKIQKFLSTRQIISLTGLRKVGKTTIMMKIAEDFIKKLGKENVCYFSFDEFKEIKIDEIIKEYSLILRKNLTKGKYLFLFDEIQKIENWEEQIKRIYDENLNFKIIISGSESLFIRKNSKESLAGRIYEFIVFPLNFKEFLLFKEKSFKNLKLHKHEILIELGNFLLCNGFPEIVFENAEISEKYLKESVIEKIIYRDIPQIIPIKEPAVLEQIFNIILEDPGEIINLDDLSQELGISRQTISLYLNYLEKSFLIKKLYNYSRNARKTQKKSKKYYPTIISKSLLDKKEFFGKTFETIVVRELNAEFFWRDTYKNEVDIILKDKTITPVEVKAGKIEDKPLKLFMKKYKVSNGIIITYDKNGKTIYGKNKIKIIPFYEYALEKPKL